MLERQTIDPRLDAEKMGGSRIRIVQPGDTLHAIAFASGLNVNDLAAWNRIADTSRLAVGQRIRLTKPLNYVKTPDAQRRESTENASAATGPTQDRGSAKSATAADSPPARNPKTSSGGVTDGVSPGNSKENLTVGRLDWRWPTAGKVITSFNVARGQQGIDIQGEPGQAVKAAVGGEVVYVGNGLKGYGNLVIIKHSAVYLSAYAHNRETFVSEGQRVEASYRIASLGRDKRERDALHFQIRRNGQPVNPLSYLPRK
ncbi:MAG: peptidoglycan DD-metalloendopeptidase family protein [Gammaproteobacteria bacterium]|nr:peptidoglycan DD-metalloendopeptidase family protein [Gammaproteobacteria bacterium]